MVTLMSESGWSKIDVDTDKCEAYRYTVTMAIKVDCTSRDKRQTSEEYRQVVIMYGCDFGASDISQMLDFLKTKCSFEQPIRWIGIITTGPGQGGAGGRRDAVFVLHNKDVMKLAPNMRLRQALDIHWLEDAYDNGGLDIYPDWFIAKYPKSW